jgi:hypothetical protein
LQQVDKNGFDSRNLHGCRTLAANAIKRCTPTQYIPNSGLRKGTTSGKRERRDTESEQPVTGTHLDNHHISPAFWQIAQNIFSNDMQTKPPTLQQAHEQDSPPTAAILQNAPLMSAVIGGWGITRDDAYLAGCG